MWPVGRLIEARDQPQARRLARARRPEHRKELAGDNVEIDAVDRLHRAEMALARRETEPRSNVRLGTRADGMGFPPTEKRVAETGGAGSSGPPAICHQALADRLDAQRPPITAM